jgi:arylsulfatase
VQYFEQFGHRGLWLDGWKAVTYHQKGVPFEADDWALYNLEQDYSECHDLAKEHPEKLRQMVDAWWSEAEKHGVLPLDDRTWELFGGSPRSGTPHSGDEYVYWPPISHIPADPAPPLGGRSWTIVCDVEVPESGCEGVLYARGSQNVGHTFFIKDRKLQFDYNALGQHYRAAFDLTLTPGAHQIEAQFDRHSRTGTLTLAVDGAGLGSIEIGTVVRMLGSTGMDLGRDRLSPVASDYEGPFPFTGRLLKVVFKIRSQRDRADVTAETRTEMAKE